MWIECMHVLMLLVILIFANSPFKLNQFTLFSFVISKINYKKWFKLFCSEFLPSQEQKCEETFWKSCKIDFKEMPFNYTLKQCHTPLVKVCHLFLGPFERVLIYRKELSLCNKSQFSNTYICTTKLCKPLIFQTLIVWYNRNHSLKYLRSTTLGY